MKSARAPCPLIGVGLLPTRDVAAALALALQDLTRGRHYLEFADAASYLDLCSGVSGHAIMPSSA